MATPYGGRAIEPSLIARAAGAVRYLLTGKSPDTFFGPAQPIAPVAQQDAAGRQFDYPVGYNLQYRPRADESVDFPTLRALADNYDLLRLAIETRKDQMGKLKWTVVRRDGTGDADDDSKAAAIRDFLELPDGEHDFLTWQRMLLEDLFVIDAPTCYIRPTLGGQPFALEPIDGATIKRVLDPTGRTPAPPQPAYQQIIKGLPAVDYHRDELLYYPRNQRTHKVYGYSPVEQIIMIVNIGLRREVAQLEYYTAGNIPDVFIATPPSWNPDQIKMFQAYWDEILAGDTAARRRARFIPGGMDPKPMKEGSSLFDPFDEWLARVICYTFNLPPNAFVKQQNRATAENAQEIALEEGLAPIMEWDVRFMNRLIWLGWKTRDYVFAWQDEQDIDPQVQATIDVMYAGGPTGNGPKIRGVQEIRDDHGWGPLPAELKAEADAKLEAIKNPPPAPGAPNESVDPNAQDGKGDANKLVKRRSLRRRY